MEAEEYEEETRYAGCRLDHDGDWIKPPRTCLVKPVKGVEQLFQE